MPKQIAIRKRNVYLRFLLAPLIFVNDSLGTPSTWIQREEHPSFPPQRRRKKPFILITVVTIPLIPSQSS